MSEPITTGAGIFGLSKLGGLAAAGGIGAGVAAYIAMTMTKPKDDKEFRVALASTIAVSLFGSAAAIKYFGIENWADDVIGLMGMGGVMFACGLPGWLLVRALFRYIEKRKDADLAEIVKDVKEMV